MFQINYNSIKQILTFTNGINTLLLLYSMPVRRLIMLYYYFFQVIDVTVL